MTATYLLDDFGEAPRSRYGTEWISFSDAVLDGTSEVRLEWEQEQGRRLLCLRGEVRSERGFVQAALPLVHSRYLFDARHFEGVWLQARSRESAGFWLNLRTRELSMPWQHYRAPFAPTAEWRLIEVPFAAFTPVATGHALNLERLSQIGVVAGLRCFSPELQLSGIGFY